MPVAKNVISKCLVFGKRPEIALDLEAVPEGDGLSEKCAEADGRGDGAFAVDDPVDRAGRDADGGEVFL